MAGQTTCLLTAPPMPLLRDQRIRHGAAAASPARPADRYHLPASKAVLRAPWPRAVRRRMPRDPDDAYDCRYLPGSARSPRALATRMICACPSCSTAHSAGRGGNRLQQSMSPFLLVARVDPAYAQHSCAQISTVPNSKHCSKTFPCSKTQECAAQHISNFCMASTATVSSGQQILKQAQTLINTLRYTILHSALGFKHVH